MARERLGEDLANGGSDVGRWHHTGRTGREEDETNWVF